MILYQITDIIINLNLQGFYSIFRTNERFNFFTLQIPIENEYMGVTYSGREWGRTSTVQGTVQ